MKSIKNTKTYSVLGIMSIIVAFLFLTIPSTVVGQYGYASYDYGGYGGGYGGYGYASYDYGGDYGYASYDYGLGDYGYASYDYGLGDYGYASYDYGGDYGYASYDYGLGDYGYASYDYGLGDYGYASYDYGLGDYGYASYDYGGDYGYASYDYGLGDYGYASYDYDDLADVGYVSGNGDDLVDTGMLAYTPTYGCLGSECGGGIPVMREVSEGGGGGLPIPSGGGGGSTGGGGSSGGSSGGGGFSGDRGGSSTYIVTSTSDMEVQCIIDDNRVEVGEEVRFEVEIEDGESPYEIDWDFDDGEDGDSRIERHTFDKKGTYHVMVVVEDDEGDRDSDNCTVYVGDEEDSDDWDMQCLVDDTSIEEGDTVEYEVEIDDCDDIDYIEWYGDISGDDETERVRYNRDGHYEVSVKVSCDHEIKRDTCPVVRVSDEDDDDDGINVITSTGLPTPSGQLASLSSVFLSQVPYTGPVEDIIRIISIILGSLIFAFLVALGLKKQRAVKRISNRIAEFRQRNKEAKMTT
jgi:hypothetical protein